MDVTDGFSPAGVTSLALTLQHRCFAAAEEIAHYDDSPEIANALAPLAAQVEQIGQLVTTLHLTLDTHPQITPRLQACLNQYFSACDPAMAALTKQLMRLQPGALHDVNWHFLTSQRDLLKAYNDLFVYLEEILQLEDREGQDASLNSPRGGFILEQTDRTIQAAAQMNSVLLSGNVEPEAEKDTPAYTPQTHSKTPETLDPDAPPPYQPPEAGDEPPAVPEKAPISPRVVDQRTPSDPNSRSAMLQADGPHEERSSSASSSRAGSSQAGSSQTGASSSSAWDKTSFSSLTRSFKALTSSLRSKPDPLVSALCQATTNGDVQQVAGLLKHGANISGRDENGDTPLHCAIRADQGKTAEHLLSAGADVTGSGWSKMPPLFFAASLGSLDVARVILAKGARVDQRNTSGQPYFYEVVSAGNMDGIQFLLESGANANISSINGRPVIVLGAKKNNIELVQLLIRFGAEVNVTDMTGSSLLAVAAEKADLAMVDLLIQHGAKPNSRTLNGVTVLAEAINKGKAELAIKLLESGADANSWDLMGQGVIIPALKDIRAAPEKKLELVSTLLQKGANVHATTTGWSTPCVWLAVESGSLDLVKLLLQHGANPSALRQDVTLLVYAVDKNETKLTKLLLRHGADSNLADKKGRTPMVMAVMRQNLDMMHLLIANGASIEGIAEKTPPADLAKAMNNQEIADTLRLSRPRPEGPRRLSKQSSGIES